MRDNPNKAYGRKATFLVCNSAFKAAYDRETGTWKAKPTVFYRESNARLRKIRLVMKRYNHMNWSDLYYDYE